ncbi:putative Ig domain-containing protein [Gemella haemolysans]|uniref:putative Ig domain-containing protein n=1 Tax=Gemella haemolysans TaxID=1379 RepID=UPI00195E260D|nr:putative Ig domain-containing protein [Gemella haemolysans]VTX61655.1 Serine-rich adhesin for platelets [Gemella haemolysans]
MKLEKRQKYAIRKLSVGVASVLAAQFYVGSVSDVSEVQAGEVVGTEVVNKVDDASAGKPKDTEVEVIGKKQESTVESSTNVGTKPKSEENADKKTADKVDTKEKEAEKTSEAKEKEDKKFLESKEVQEAKDTLSNRLLESKAVSQEAEKYIAGKDVSAEVRTKLTKYLESSKQEENKAQQVLTKDKASLEELNNSVRTLETALEVLYLELRRAGHSGKVSYRLETTVTPAETSTDSPELTPRTGSKVIYSNGAPISTEIGYDISNVVYGNDDTNENTYYNGNRNFALNEDAKKLGLRASYSSFTGSDGKTHYKGYLTGAVLPSVEPGLYNVGFTYRGKSYTTNVEVKSSEGAPYMTLERYFGDDSGRNIRDYKLKKDGSTVDLKYKVGLTRIGWDDVELTPDAKALGYTFDKTTGYITKTVTLNNSIESRNYVIGVQSKTDPYTRAVANLTIEEPPVFKVVKDLRDTSDINNPRGDSVTYDSSTNTAYMTATPFGYYLESNEPQTIADATPNSPQYTSNLWLSLPGKRNEYNIVNNVAPITITKLEQTGGSDGVKVELIKDGPATGDNLFINGSSSVSDVLTDNVSVESQTSGMWYKSEISPYRLNFKSLPERAGTYFVDFQITDNIGRVTNYHLNLVTKEVSQTTPNKNDVLRANYTITNADVMFDADKLYRVTNPIPVAVPISDKEQKIGDLVLNKSNAILEINSKPDGVEITKDTENPTRFKVIKQNGKTLAAGVYTITATARDGHFGANVPSRTYKFEVMDGINNIDHKTLTEGQEIPNIPVSMTNGSKITKLMVESEGDYIHLSPNADNTGLVGYALKKTDGRKEAVVTATYTNTEGQSRQIKTKFTYEVNASPVTDLALSITNDKQTVVEGTKFKDMVVTATDGATVTVDPTKLPEGITYDESTKTLSGKGQYEGRYIIPVKATKNDKSITKLVDLTVTPGNFSVPEASYILTAGNEITPITLKIPANATVSSVGGTLPRGLSWSADRKTITGTPTQVGTFQVYGYVNRTTAGGTNQSTYGYVNITVNSVPLNFSIPDNTKTVKALDELPPINLQADGAVLSITSGSLPPGVNYDAATKTVSGTPTKVGTYTATFTATSPTISGNSTASATLTIEVTPRDLSVEVANKEQEKTVLTAIDNVVLNPSDTKARLEVDTSKLPPGVTYNSDTRTISGTPSKVGEYLIPYKATFPEMAESPVDGGHIKINVRPLPVSINVTEKEQTVRLGTAIKNMLVTHSEHSNLGARYLSVDLPETDLDSYLESTAGLNYNAATHTISGTPTKPGVYKVRLKATLDSETLGKGSAEEIIIVTVVDDPVSLDIKNDRQMIALGKTGLRPITFAVPTGATLTFDKTKLPAGVTYDEASKTISGTPTVAGAFDIPVTVTSTGGKFLTKDITIDVVDLTPPTPTVTVKENNDGTHTITISQPGGKPVETIIKNGKDGETPKVKVDRDETKKETTLTFYSDKNANNQFDEETDTVLGISVIKDGQDGAKGGAGVAGPKGDKGDAGVAGPKGDKGEAGVTGRDGKDILNGTSTPTAQDGKDGDTFINTTTGDVLVKKDGEWKPVGNIKGAKGDKGDQGLQGRDGQNGTNGQNGRDGKDILNGTSIPTAQDGKDGDTFINTTTGDVLVKRDGTWQQAGNIKGAKGDKGDQGLQGHDGQNGADGANGRDGKDILSGTSTPTATDGKDGDTFINTTTGDVLVKRDGTWQQAGNIKGAKGDKGETGVAGPKGDKGDAGKDGFTPTVSVVTNPDGSHTISIAQPDGKEPITTTVKNGENGKDGRAPRVELKPIYPAQPRSTRRARSVDVTPASQPTPKPIGVHITVYYDNDNSLTYTAGDTLISEEDIYNGVDGVNGRDGVDGKSATIETKENADGSRTIIITNPDGSKNELIIKNGKDGKCTCENKPTNDKPQEPKDDKPVPPREDKPQEPKGDKPVPPREDKPQEPKGDKPVPPREDKTQVPERDNVVPPRENKPQESNVKMPLPFGASEQLTPTLDSVKGTVRKGLLANTGEEKSDTSIFFGSAVLLALYLLRKKEN